MGLVGDSFKKDVTVTHVKKKSKGWTLGKHIASFHGKY